MKNKLIFLKEAISREKLDANDVGVIKTSVGDISLVYFPRINKSVEIKNTLLQSLNPSKYGDGRAEKICNICHKILPTKLFDPNQNGKGDRQVRRPTCKSCRKSIDGVAMSSAEKRIWMESKPDLEDFECPICKKVTISGVTSRIVLNHDHSTGRITGWICDSCNTGLGRFKDNKETLERAIKYLEDH